MPNADQKPIAVSHAVKTRYHHGNLRAVLLTTAEDMLERDGMVALSLRAVAKQAGVSHAAPYRHFANKQALLEALAAGGFEALERAIDDAAAKHPGDPRQQLIETGAAYVREAVARPQRAQLMFGGSLGFEAARGPARTAFDALTNVVRRGQKAGLFEPAPTRELVLSVWSAAHGLAMLIVGQQIRHLDLAVDISHLWRAVFRNHLRKPT